MPTYNASIIQQHAQNLYDRADAIVWQAVLSGGFSGALVGWGLTVLLKYAEMDVIPAWMVVTGAAAILGAWAGVAAEREVFRLRLEAQQALCHMMIERNTAAAARHLEMLRRGQDAPQI